MNDVIALLRPRITSIRNGGLSKSQNGRLFKLLLLGTIGVLFWGGLFAVSLRVLYYFKGIEEIGDILGYKLLSMILLISFALLIFSSILTSLSKLYLSRDLFLVHSMPVSSHNIFLARWIDSTAESSWMVIIYTLPVFMAYGIVYHSGIFFYICLVLSIVSLSVIASAISTLLVMSVVILIPASRMKNIFIFFSILFFVVLYLAIRFLQPELLVDPEVFDSALVYITALETPSSPFLPSTWAFDGIKAALIGSFTEELFHTALSWSFAGTLVFVLIIAARALYFKGFSKTQTAQVRLIKSRSALSWFFRFLPGSIKAVTENFSFKN